MVSKKLVESDKFKLISLDKLRLADWNYKEEDAELAQKLLENIKRVGQIENLIVRELDSGTYEIVNGNHRYIALQQLGSPNALCYDLGSISLDAAQRIAIETNESKFKADSVKLAGIFKELSKEFSLEDLIATMPYNQQQIDEYIKMADFDWTQFNKDAQGQQQGDSNIEQPTVKLIIEVTKELLDDWNSYKAHIAEQDDSAALSALLEEAFSGWAGSK